MTRFNTVDEAKNAFTEAFGEAEILSCFENYVAEANLTTARVLVDRICSVEKNVATKASQQIVEEFGIDLQALRKILEDGSDLTDGKSFLQEFIDKANEIKANLELIRSLSQRVERAEETLKELSDIKDRMEKAEKAISDFPSLVDQKINEDNHLKCQKLNANLSQFKQALVAAIDNMACPVDVLASDEGDQAQNNTGSAEPMSAII